MKGTTVEPKAIVLSGYGFNADAELAEALRLAGAKPERLHVADLAADPARLEGARILAFPAASPSATTSVRDRFWPCSAAGR